MKRFKLDQYPKTDTGFKVPDGYFDDFSLRMMNRLPSARPKVIQLQARRQSWLAIAAALALGLTIPALDQFLTGTAGASVDTAMESYLAYQSGLTTDEISEVLTMEDIKNINVTYDIDDRTLEDAVLQTNDIQNYID
jgi:hypothetical protein